MIPTVSRCDSMNFIDFLPAVRGKLHLKDVKLRILKLSLEHFYEGRFWEIDEREVNVFLDCFDTVEYNLNLDLEEELRVVGSLISLCEMGMSEAKKLVDLALRSPFMIDKINEITDGIKSIDFELKYLSSVYDELSLFNQIHIINQNSSVSYDVFGLAVDSLKSYSGYKHQLRIFKKTSLIFLGRITAGRSAERSLKMPTQASAN